MFISCQGILQQKYFYVIIFLIIILRRVGRMNTGSRIAQRRQELGISKSDLAKKAGLSPTIIGLYEIGEREPSFETKLKLCKALEVAFSFFDFVSRSNDYNDPLVNIIIRGIKGFDQEQKKKLFEYYCMLANNKSISCELPIYDNLDMYVKDLLTRMKINKPPINPTEILSNLGCTLVSSERLDDYEAILIKDKISLIFFDKNIAAQRLNFTFAHIIAHLVLPWHVASQFKCRPKGKSSYHEEDVIESEAHIFAAALLMPEEQLREHLQLTAPTFNDLDKLANLYDVTRLAMATRYVYLSNGHSAIIRSKDGKIYSSIIHPDFDYDFIQENLSPQSIAYELFHRKPKTLSTDIGIVPSAAWFKDASTGFLTEESLYNPSYPGEILSLLHKS